MQPAERPLRMIKGGIALRDARVQSTSRKLLLAKRAREEAAVVLVWFQVDQVSARERSFGKDHSGRLVPFCFQKKSWSIWWVRMRCLSCFRRVKPGALKVSGVMAI